MITRRTLGRVAIAASMGARSMNAQTPPTAASLLETAAAEASAGHRRIFVNFHASW
jgi:hypothetical protein